MSRRISYSGIAAAFAITKPITDGVLSIQWRVDVLAIADVLGTSNPKFNRRRFLNAAGVWTEVTEASHPNGSAASQHFIDTGRRDH